MSGYSFLEASDSTPPTYTHKYTLDTAGNTKAIALFTEENDKGDRRFDDKVTATGTVVGGEFQVQSLALAPRTYTGYLVDNFCWNKDNNTGVDKTNLGVEPERHYLHCLVLPQCNVSGYSFLEASDSTPPTYTRKYTLDTAGNSKAIALFTEEHAKGDRRFNDKVTATGHVVDGVLQVQTLALASSSVPDPRTDTSSALKVSSNAVGFLLATGLSAALF